jgi:hypothetical protein
MLLSLRPYLIMSNVHMRGCGGFQVPRPCFAVGPVGTGRRALQLHVSSRNHAKGSAKGLRSIGRTSPDRLDSFSGPPLAGLKTRLNGASSGAMATARHDLIGALAALPRIKSPTAFSAARSR